MTADAQTGGQELAKTRSLRMVAIVLAVVMFGALAVSFGISLSPWYQAGAGIAAYICVEWQRQLSKKIKTLGG